MFERKPVNSLENRDPALIERITGIVRKTLWPYHRAEVRGLERIPGAGGVIYVGNHNGYPYMAEGWLFTAALYEAFGMSRFPYFLVHEHAIELPVINQVLTGYGGLGASSRNALRLVSGGHPMLIYPGAAEELMRPYRERARLRFNGRDAHVRLALRFNTPIVPVAAVGGHSTAIILDDLPWLAELLGIKERFNLGAWPLMLSIPWGLTLGPIIPPYVPWPAKIIVEALEPIHFARTGREAARDPVWVQKCAAKVERAIASAVERLERERVEKHGLLRFALGKAVEHIERALELGDGGGVRLPALPRFTEHVDIRGLFPATPEESGARADEPARAERRGVTARARFTAAERRRIVREAATRGVAAVCDEHGVSRSTVYRWRRALREQARARASSSARARRDDARIRRAVLKARRGARVVDVCREHGISRSTFYRWKSRLDE
ncbi:MAG: transposase [Myxococcales bacterium]|nr:transposase [Myxococcales bacterium]